MVRGADDIAALIGCLAPTNQRDVIWIVFKRDIVLVVGWVVGL